MKKPEKLVLLNWANQLSDQELKKEHCNAINILADAIEDNHYFGVPYPDTLEERVNLLGRICTERGISIWFYIGYKAQQRVKEGADLPDGSLPCPHCGSHNLKVQCLMGHYNVVCCDCNTDYPGYDTLEEAIQEWSWEGEVEDSKKGTEPRNTVLTIRLSNAEKAELKKRASRKGLSVSAFIISRTLENKDSPGE